MRKKTKSKQSKNPSQNNKEIASEMMTQQEEKMYYTDKKRNYQQSSQNQNFNLKPTFRSQNAQASNREMDQDDQNVGQVQLCNLNQTSAQEITEFINKLIAKNKVTSKNAFDIPLIHLEQMQDYRSSLNQNTWKRLSSTLENDYKIYGYRVDATHTITYKMVESIARHQTSIEETLGINREKFQKDENQNKKQSSNNQLLTSFLENSTTNVSKNKLNVDYTKFIQRNQKLLNVTHLQAFFSYNPGLEKTKRQFDQQGLKTLLLNNISLRNGNQLRLDEHRKNLRNGEDQAKKQADENKTQNQHYEMFQNEASQLFERIYPSDSPQQNLIQLQNSQSNIFTTIYELNINQGQATKDEFNKFQRLYKIISGEDREEKKNNLKKKFQQSQLEEQNKELNNAQMINQQDFQQNENLPDSEKLIQIPQQFANQEYDNNLQNEQKHIIQEIQLDKNAQNLNNWPINKQIQRKSDQSEQLSKQLSQNSKKINDKVNQEEQGHVLRDKNFQMHEMNLQNLQQSQSQQHNHISEAVSKFKNIQQYINIKQPRIKNQRKKKIQGDQLSSDQIGKKLFNRKYRKKRDESSSNRDSSFLKQEQSNSQHKQKKVNFTKINSQSLNLKRAVIFKKSVPEERAFNQIKGRLKLKLDQKEKDSILQQQPDKKKKNKRFRIFDLPVYEFEKSDTNFIDPLEQLNPQTNQLAYSDLYTNLFPNFLFCSNALISSAENRRQQRQRESQQKRKQTLSQNEKNKETQQQQAIQIQILEQNNINAQQPDISFILDQMGQHRGANQQIAIRQAKQKMKAIMLKMLSNLKLKKRKKSASNKICFKQIYEAYYRQEGFISPALCFLTVLHLANQHNLVLQGKEDGTDFKIFVQEENQINYNLEDKHAKEQKQHEVTAELITEEKKYQKIERKIRYFEEKQKDSDQIEIQEQ